MKTRIYGKSGSEVSELVIVCIGLPFSYCLSFSKIEAISVIRIAYDCNI